MTCGGEIRHLAGKKEKKPAALLDYLSCGPPQIIETHIGNKKKTARHLKKFAGQTEQVYFRWIR